MNRKIIATVQHDDTTVTVERLDQITRSALLSALIDEIAREGHLDHTAVRAVRHDYDGDNGLAPIPCIRHAWAQRDDVRITLLTEAVSGTIRIEAHYVGNGDPYNGEADNGRAAWEFGALMDSIDRAIAMQHGNRVVRNVAASPAWTTAAHDLRFDLLMAETDAFDPTAMP